MSDARQQALDYLASHHVMTLATTGREGVWAAAVFYVNNGFDLLFLSAGHTRHAQNVALNAQAAATIQEDYQDWAAIRGIQCAGEVQRLSGVGQATAVARYLQKFPFLQQAPPPISAALTKVNWYCLRPQRLYFVDNSKGFGHRDEISLQSHTV